MVRQTLEQVQQEGKADIKHGIYKQGRVGIPSTRIPDAVTVGGSRGQRMDT